MPIHIELDKYWKVTENDKENNRPNQWNQERLEIRSFEFELFNFYLRDRLEFMPNESVNLCKSNLLVYFVFFYSFFK